MSDTRDPGSDDSDDEALSWGDERDPSLVTTGDSETNERSEQAGVGEPRPGTGSALLVFYGAAAGVYVLYTVGWVLAALADTTPASSVFAQLMHEFGLFCAIVAPALWVLAVFALAKRPRMRVLGLILGAMLLVPWPFVMGVWT